MKLENFSLKRNREDIPSNGYNSYNSKESNDTKGLLVNDEYIHMSANRSKVHHSTRLKRLKVTYHKSDKILDCQCCSRKITCIHNAIVISYLTQCNI